MAQPEVIDLTMDDVEEDNNNGNNNNGNTGIGKPVSAPRANSQEEGEDGSETTHAQSKKADKDKGGNANKGNDNNDNGNDNNDNDSDNNDNDKEAKNKKKKDKQTAAQTNTGKSDNSSGDNENELPELLNPGSGGQTPFPGATCVTVARAGKMGRGSLYINRYGPPRYPWLVLSETAHLPQGVREDDLPNASNSHQRALDYPINTDRQEHLDKKFGKKDIKGLLGVVWKFNEQLHPYEAVKALDPKKVKRGYDTTEKRRKFRETHKKKHLDPYPTTYTWVLFHRSIYDLLDPKSRKSKKDNWELGSSYRNAYGKGSIQKETDLYECAKRQADRFLKWYQENVSTKIREGSVINPARYATEDRRLPTVAPGTRASSVASSASDTGGNDDTSDTDNTSDADDTNDTGDPDNPYPSIETEERSKTPKQGSRSKTQKQSSRSTPKGSSKSKTPKRSSRKQTEKPSEAPEEDNEGGKIDEETLKKLVLEGFMFKRGIDGPLTKTQQREFDIVWKFAK